MEMCAPEKEKSADTINFITHIAVTGTCAHDVKSLQPAIDRADMAGFHPDRVLADTAYGADEAVEKAALGGTKVISPVGGKDPEADRIRIAEFEHDEAGVVTACPKGMKPWHTDVTANGAVTACFDRQRCETCESKDRCPAFNPVKGFRKGELKYSAKDMRLSIRRAWEGTDEFKTSYAMRSGIEATNSRLDRQSSFKHVRYRGRSKIKFASTCKAIFLNLLRIMPHLRENSG
jgi:IS5 family transposase